MVQGQSNTLACTMGCPQPVRTVSDQGPSVQNFALPSQGFVSGSHGPHVLENNQFLQKVDDTTPVKNTTSGNLKGGLARQLKQKVKYQQFKGKKQQQQHSDNQLFYVGGQAYQRVQNQVQGQQHFVQQQQGFGNYLLNPASAALGGTPPQVSHPPAGGAG